MSGNLPLCHVFVYWYFVLYLTPTTVNFWRDVRNRRQFFINVARKIGFDPFVAKNWYGIDDATISLHKVR